ncbi:MAG: hypothetical protein FWG75_00495 [Cystobacterineae bacterium]|nr:hypothetical protein [Cystobacterineae bacterium]
MSISWEKASKWIAGAGILLLGISLFVATKQAYVNSDNAWYAIMGRGIAEGNILLKNFMGSTMSHYFPYAIIEGFWSLFFHHYELVHTLSILSLTLFWGYVLFLAIQVLSEKKPNIFIILTLVTLVVSMPPTLLAEAYVHFAPVLCALLAACLYYGKNRSTWVKYGIIALLASWTNNYNIVYFLIPITLENLLYYIKTKKIDPMAKWVVVGMVAYLIRHMLLKNIGLEVPGASPILESARTLTHFGELGDNFSKIYLSFSALFSADFWGMKLEKAIPSLWFFIAMLLALYVQAKYSLKIYKEKSSEENRFMVFLLLGSISILGIHLFSQLLISSRYLTSLFINSLVILGYGLNRRWPEGKKLGMIFIVTFALSMIHQTIHGRYGVDPKLKERQEIAKVIRSEKLNNGYAWFGNSLSINFVMNEQRIASLHPRTNNPMLWLVDKNTFYRPGKFDFLISWIDGGAVAWREEGGGEWGEHDLNDSEIREIFGNPRKVVKVGRVRLYVYEDITDKVKKPKLGKTARVKNSS